MPGVARVATYRLQLRKGFGLPEVRRLLPYLHDLGIDTLYLSPLLRATPGSDHGYDVIDPTTIDPDRGTERDLAALAAAAHAVGIAILLDFVPNHLAATPRNPWWSDVLRRGRSSEFADVFDIEWTDERGGRAAVVLPVLEGSVAAAVNSGDLRLAWHDEDVALELRGERYPLSPESEAALVRAAGGPRDSEAARRLVDAFARAAPAGRRVRGWPAKLLAEQHYRFVPYRAVDRVNYRRFFDINGLVGVRVEDPSVFERTHARLLAWVGSGWVDGIRVDHVDGLADPTAYLRRLRRRLRDVAPRGRKVPIWVEKILAAGERLPPEWPVEGTTGYESMDRLTQLYLDPRGVSQITDSYRRRSPESFPFRAVAFRAKEDVAATLFPHERADLARRREPGPGGHRAPGARARALGALTAGLPVYRTYGRRRGLRRVDRPAVRRAMGVARKERPGRASELRGLARELGSRWRSAESGRRWRRWQQWTGAVAAKGVEDTAFYRYNALLAENEVGSEPGRPPGSDRQFHREQLRRIRAGDRSLTASTTHDAKWGEQARARLTALSELPGEWEVFATERLGPAESARSSPAPERLPYSYESRLLQAALAVAPPVRGPSRGFSDRLAAFAVKSARESRRWSSWRSPSEKLEAVAVRRARAFGARRALRDRQVGSRTRPGFAAELAVLGFWTSLSQTVLKVGLPGVPDFYQGSEASSLHLVDPDNRRPVEFDHLRNLAAGLGRDRGPASPHRIRGWARSVPNEPLQFYVTRRALAVRRSRPGVFDGGEYIPLPSGGRRGRTPIAWARRHGKDWAVVVAARGLRRFGVGPGQPASPTTFSGAWVRLPRRAPRRWIDELTARGAPIQTDRAGRLDLAEVLGPLPFALLVGASEASN